MSEIENALKELEKKQAQLLEQRKSLELQLKEKEKEDKKLEELFQKSGFANPRSLVIALMDKYNIRSVSTAATPVATKGRRKRTKVTAALRDKVRAAVNGGMSKNQATKDFAISYLVVNKIMAGAYDKLK